MNCSSSSNPCPQYPNTDCVVYTGGTLPCSGIRTNDRLSTILSKIEAKICTIVSQTDGPKATYDFVVASNTPIKTGDDFKYLTNFVGNNLLFFRNGALQSINNTGYSYYTYNLITGKLDIFPAASEGELFQLYAI